MWRWLNKISGYFQVDFINYTSLSKDQTLLNPPGLFFSFDADLGPISPKYSNITSFYFFMQPVLSYYLCKFFLFIFSKYAQITVSFNTMYCDQFLLWSDTGVIQYEHVGFTQQSIESGCKHKVFVEIVSTMYWALSTKCMQWTADQ